MKAGCNTRFRKIDIMIDINADLYPPRKQIFTPGQPSTAVYTETQDFTLCDHLVLCGFENLLPLL